MTRGNQREIDRERAKKRQDAAPKKKESGETLVSKKEKDAEIMRQKQEKALAKKESESK